MLINCVAYEHGSRQADLSVEEISDYLERPDCFVWVALRDATAEELDKMQEEFGLHELAVEDARHGHQRPKIEEYGDSVFAVMHLVEPLDGEFNLGEVNVFVGPNYVLSVRNRSQQHFLGVRERCEREPHLLTQGSGFVFYALMDAVVDRYFPIIDQLETELEEIESRIFAKGDARSNTERLYTLKRKIMVLKHAIAPLMEAAGKLSGNRGCPGCCRGRR
jgi:magnesium transporter